MARKLTALRNIGVAARSGSKVFRAAGTSIRNAHRAVLTYAEQVSRSPVSQLAAEAVYQVGQAGYKGSLTADWAGARAHLRAALAILRRIDQREDFAHANTRPTMDKVRHALQITNLLEV